MVGMYLGFIIVRATYVSADAEKVSNKLVDLLDEVEEDPRDFLVDCGTFSGDGEDEKVVEDLPVRSGCFLRCAVAVALIIRAKHVMLRRTEANRLMVAATASKILELRHTRKCDIARLLPIIIVAVFVPLKEDRMAQELTGTSRIMREVYRAERVYRSAGPIDRLVERWLGGRRLEWTQ